MYECISLVRKIDIVILGRHITPDPPLTGIRTSTTAPSLGGESGRMADWTSNTGYGDRRPQHVRGDPDGVVLVRLGMHDECRDAFL